MESTRPRKRNTFPNDTDPLLSSRNYAKREVTGGGRWKRTGASGFGVNGSRMRLIGNRTGGSGWMGRTCSAACCSVSAHQTISAGETRCLEGTAACAVSSASNAANTYWATARAILLDCTMAGGFPCESICITKGVLTVIAILLSVIAFNSGHPASFDTRTGEIWFYTGDRLDFKYRPTKLGGPLFKEK